MHASKGQRTLVLCTIPCVVLMLGCETDVAANLDEGQADEIVLALDAAGIGARKIGTETIGSGEQSYTVRVARAELASALAVLRDEELPRRRAPGFESLFAERGLVPSASEERGRHAAAVAGEIGRSLETIDGVHRARVHVALADTSARMLDAEPSRPRASVLIEERRGARIDDDAVRALVAGAISDLRTEDVAVVRTPALRASRARPRLAYVGPIAVARGSAGSLKAMFATSFALNLILAAALVLARMRRTAASNVGAELVREPRSG